jgi:hypothetical protein
LRENNLDHRWDLHFASPTQTTGTPQEPYAIAVGMPYRLALILAFTAAAPD